MFELNKAFVVYTYKTFRRISYAELEEQKKSKTESGYCWELRDNNLDKVIGNNR